MDRAGCLSVPARGPKHPGRSMIDRSRSAVLYQNQKRITRRVRGYRELHTRAFKLLSKEGLLATFSCSHHVSDAAFSQNDL